MSGGRRMKQILKRTLCLQLSMVALSNGLGLLCFLWHCKPAACGRQVEFIEVSGNPNAVSEEAESWVPLDLPTRQWSQAYLKFHQGLVAEKVLEDSTLAITLNWLEDLWWDLKKAVVAPKNIIELRPLFLRNGPWSLRNAARSWCLVIHFVCRRS